MPKKTQQQLLAMYNLVATLYPFHSLSEGLNLITHSFTPNGNHDEVKSTELILNNRFTLNERVVSFLVSKEKDTGPTYTHQANPVVMGKTYEEGVEAIFNLLTEDSPYIFIWLPHPQNRNLKCFKNIRDLGFQEIKYDYVASLGGSWPENG